MKPLSPGLATDLMLVRLDGRVHERLGYLVAETPSNPSFYWGNFLVFGAPPTVADAVRWHELFTREFAQNPLVRHVALAWDSKLEKNAATQTLTEAGFELTEELVLTAGGPAELQTPRHFNNQLFIRPLKSGSDWNALLCLEELHRPPEIPAMDYTFFLRAQLARYERFSLANQGRCYGAFLGSKLVGSAGLFVDKSLRLGRFQRVCTHPKFLRQGICGTLLHTIASQGFERLGATKLVIVADPAYVAARVYESLGFKPTHYYSGALLRPAQNSSAKTGVTL